MQEDTCQVWYDKGFIFIHCSEETYRVTLNDARKAVGDLSKSSDPDLQKLAGIIACSLNEN